MVTLSPKKRDFLFFVLLVVMVRIAINRQQITEPSAILYAPADSSHIELPVVETLKKEPVTLSKDDAPLSKNIDVRFDTNDSNQQETVHQLDEHLLYQLNALVDQIDETRSLIKSTQSEAADLQSIRFHLILLKRKYQHISPAISLLGPLGTAGLILKEQTLEQELLQVAHRLETIIAAITKQGSKEHSASKNVIEALEHNKRKLTMLSSIDKESPIDEPDMSIDLS